MKIGKLAGRMPGKWKVFAIAAAVLATAVGGVIAVRHHQAGSRVEQGVMYQCPMHPQIIQDHPGDCPICHMKLEKVVVDRPSGPATKQAKPQKSGAPGRTSFALSEERRQLIGVKTGRAERRDLSRRLRLPGRATGPDSVTAELLEMDAGTVRTGMRAVLIGPGDARTDALVTGVDPNFDALTRSYSVSVGAKEGADWLRPGLYCEVDIQLEFGKRLAVAEDAVLNSGERTVVFLAHPNGTFEPREIRTGRAGEGWVEVRSGLKEGDRVVTSANFLIDSESRFKSALEQF